MFIRRQLTRLWYSNIILVFFLGLAVFLVWHIINQTAITSDIKQQKLQKEAQINLLQQQNQRQQLENQFLTSDYYVDLAIRRQKGYTLQGENLYVISASKIQKLKQAYQGEAPAKDNDQKMQQSNLQTWFDFLLGRSQSSITQPRQAR